jgi:DNA polymerase III subunit delta'
MSDTADDFPEADRLDGTPHPRETYRLFGHGAEERMLLDAYRSGQMHHAWIIGGEWGIGRATLAYRAARFILANPDPRAASVAAAEKLAVDPEHPAARRMARLSHPDLFVLRRQYVPERKTIPAEIRVDDARRAVSFFGTTAGEGGWRIAIVDSADDLNINGANALLKILEEPPPRSLFLILSSAPKRLLPTVRSRCRTLNLRPLQPADLTAVLQALPDLTSGHDGPLDEIVRLAEGSVRRAALLLGEDSVELRAKVQALLDALPASDPGAVLAFAEQLNGRDGAVAFDFALRIILDWLHARMIQGAATGESRLARWAELWDKFARASRDAETYNLDRRPLVMSMMADLAEASRG